MKQLQAFQQFTTVVAGTDAFGQHAPFKPQDAATHPSRSLTAVQKAGDRSLLAA
jgi:hypothetical protein